MTINTLYDLVDYDVVSNVTEDVGEYHLTSPALLLNNTLDAYVLKDMTRNHNESFTTWFKSTTVANMTLQIQVGCNNVGDGFAVLIEETSVKFIQTSLYVQSNVLVTKDISRMIELQDDTYYSAKVLISNSKIQILVNGVLVIEYNTFIGVGNYFGYHIGTGTSNVYVSDTMYYDDQIIWGNVNVNGDIEDTAFTLLYSQIDLAFIEKSNCDTSGNWQLFIEENPIQQNKHILIGGIESMAFLQAKGIQGITL